MIGEKFAMMQYNDNLSLFLRNHVGNVHENQKDKLFNENVLFITYVL